MSNLHNGKACLHCAIRDSIHDWVNENGERRDGAVIMDIAAVLTGLQEVAAEFVHRTPEGARRSATRFAHDALDAGVKAQRTGQVQTISITSEH